MTRTERIEIRCRPALKEAVQAAAREEDRSVSNWCERALEAALSSSETPEEALNRIAQSSPEELGMSRSQARMNAMQRGSPSPSPSPRAELRAGADALKAAAMRKQQALNDAKAKKR